MSSRKMKYVMISLLAVGALYQIPSCVLASATQIGRVAIFDLLLSPFTDHCSWIDRSGCPENQPPA